MYISAYEYVQDSEIASISIDMASTPPDTDTTLQHLSEDEILDDVLEETPPVSMILDDFTFPTDEPGEPPRFVSTLDSTITVKEDEPTRFVKGINHSTGRFKRSSAFRNNII